MKGGKRRAANSKKLLHDKRGMSGLIVFAILLPFLGAFVIAVAQTTIISVGQSVVNNAAFEGARIGALKNSTTEAKMQQTTWEETFWETGIQGLP